MKYSSKDLNQMLRDLDSRDVIADVDRENLKPDNLIDTGKLIPYIGWFWRTVDFDAATYTFGIIPSGPDYVGDTRNIPGFNGFMQNNKWDYAYTRQTTTEEWENIKNLLCDAVTQPYTKEKFQAVYDAIQAIQ